MFKDDRYFLQGHLFLSTFLISYASRLCSYAMCFNGLSVFFAIECADISTKNSKVSYPHSVIVPCETGNIILLCTYEGFEPPISDCGTHTDYRPE